MSPDLEHNADEQTRLLPHATGDRRRGPQKPTDDSYSISFSSDGCPGEDQNVSSTSTEEKLQYNHFVTVDLLRDLVQ